MTLSEMRKAYPEKFYQQTVVDKFWARVQKTDTCWEWIGYRADTGYGRFLCDPSRRPFVLAHRFSYELANGPVPEGLHVHHECRNRACVNPAHLRAVNRKDHVRLDGGFMAAKAMQTSCVNGHPYDAENTKYSPNGTRYCRECNRIRGNEVYRRRGKARV